MRSSIFILLLITSGCTQKHAAEDNPAKTPDSVEIAPHCGTNGVPDVRAIYSAEGELIWDDATGAPVRGMVFEAIEIHGDNLCAGTLTLADGVNPALKLPLKIVDGKNLLVQLPRDRPRVDYSILLRTKKSFTRLNLSVLPWDEIKRQIYVNEVKQKVFAN